LADEEVAGGDQPDVGRNEVAGTQQHDVAGNQLGDRYFAGLGLGIGAGAPQHRGRGAHVTSLPATFDTCVWHENARLPPNVAKISLRLLVARRSACHVRASIY
jgi:hypothetical protein